MMEELYYGPPTADDYCARQYPIAGRRCPNYVDFYVKVPDGRSDWRKARASCCEHLPEVIWQMQKAHSHDGEYLLRTIQLQVVGFGACETEDYPKFGAEEYLNE